MRVLLVSQMYRGPEDPDLGTFVAQGVDALRARGHDVDLAVLATIVPAASFGFSSCAGTSGAQRSRLPMSSGRTFSFRLGCSRPSSVRRWS